MAKGQQIRIKLKAYDNYVVDESARKIAETVLKTQAKVKGPVPLPTQIHRYCVIRSPDRKSTRLNSSHVRTSRMPSSA